MMGDLAKLAQEQMEEAMQKACDEQVLTMRNEAGILLNEINRSGSIFRESFDSADTAEEYYIKSKSGKYVHTGVWLIPCRTAEDIHLRIVQPLMIQIALLKAKIEAYELACGKGKNNNKTEDRG